MTNIKLIDSTLRDGEQSAGIALGESKKVEIARMLDAMGIYQIEAGIPAMKGSELRSIQRIADSGLNARISTWNRALVSDVQQAMNCGDVIIHISVPVSDLHILKKLNKDRAWVLDNMVRCIYTVKSKGYEVTVGLEDASRADFPYMAQLCEKACQEGVSMIRYADTVGILHRRKTFEDIEGLRRLVTCEIGIHTHNDLGMAVSNAITAVQAGATFVDTTVGGIGERAGNCNFLDFIHAAKACFNDLNFEAPGDLSAMQQLILKKMGLKQEKQPMDLAKQGRIIHKI